MWSTFCPCLLCVWYIVEVHPSEWFDFNVYWITVLTYKSAKTREFILLT